MKKILVAALALSNVCAATSGFAASNDDVIARLDALEKENAAIRRENAALRENKTLRQQNASLKSEIAASPQTIKPASVNAKSSDPFAAYAADLPLAYKARPLDRKGQFRVWGEGGAIWSGGDPINSDYTLTALPGFGLGGIGGTANVPGSFNLTPKVGWEGAGGFDYRFADSLWHVSAQFRYGEGKASGSAAAAGVLDPAILALIGGGGGGGLGPTTSFSGSDTLFRSNTETHWLADLAVGRDVFGSGPDAMQVKFGVRLAEWVGRQTSTEAATTNLSFAPAFDVFGDGSFLVSQFSSTTTTALNQRASYVGIGPRVGIEGAVPFADKWAFDYLADVAVLFGNQKLVSTTTTTTVANPAILTGFAGGFGNSVFTNTTELFAPAISADLQVGVSYWVTPTVKVSGSYRIDAFTVFNTTTTTNNILPDRYTHGPRFGASATF